MSGVLVLLLYITCIIMGFFGGIFGYFFADHCKYKKLEKSRLIRQIAVHKQT